MRVAFVGGGNMASALVGGLIAAGSKPADIRVIEIDASARARLKQDFGVAVFEGADAGALAGTDIVVLAVKPQHMRAAAQQIAPVLGAQLVLSIAAGIRLADLARWLANRSAALVRAMPNTPALIGAGIAGLYSPKPLPREQAALVEQVMRAAGEFVWVEDEAQIDAVTALSGSGPAYVFWLAERMIESGVALGLAPEAARKLALATVLGSAKLAAQSADAPGVLRERVTSKGGTTEAALRVFEQERLGDGLKRGIEAACRRGAELGVELGKD
jgi:pyrroline-5-carboxylate reductase